MAPYQNQLKDIVDQHIQAIESKKFYPSELRLSNLQKELLKEIYLEGKPISIEDLGQRFTRSPLLMVQEIRKLEKKGVGIDHWEDNRVSLNSFVRDAQTRTNFLGLAGKERF